MHFSGNHSYYSCDSLLTLTYGSIYSAHLKHHKGFCLRYHTHLQALVKFEKKTNSSVGNYSTWQRQRSFDLLSGKRLISKTLVFQ